MTSAKIVNNIDTGLWIERSGIIASAFDDIGAEGGRYRLNFHRGQMPAHSGYQFDTLDELETEMRKHEVDLRKWNTRMDS